MTITTKRYVTIRLQIKKLEATVWERHRNYGPGQPEELDFLFTIQRLNVNKVEDAFEYGHDEIETVIQLTRWAEAHIESCYDELP